METSIMKQQDTQHEVEKRQPNKQKEKELRKQTKHKPKQTKQPKTTKIRNKIILKFK